MSLRPRPQLLGVASITATLLLSTACSSLGGGSANKPEAAGAKPTLQFWMYQPFTPQGAAVMETLKTSFEKANDVTVKLTQIAKDDYNTKLGTALASASVPDAAYLDQPLVARYAKDGTISEMPTGTIAESDYYAGALNTNKFGGKFYGLPLDHTCVALFYNKKLVPNPPKTWGELKSTAAAVHAANPKVAGVKVPKGDGYGAWMFPGFVAGAGGTMTDDAAKKVTFDQKPAVDALQLWVDLQASSPRKITDADKSFETGKAAMMISGPWDVANLKDQFKKLDFGVAPLPYMSTPGGNIGGENAVVFSKGKNAALAWKWLAYITNAENNAALADMLGGFAPNVKAAEAAPVSKDPIMGAFVEQLKVAQARPAVPQWIQINDEIMAPALERALSGKQTPQQSLSEAAVKATALLGW